MDKYTATEMAFKNGYEKGYEAGKRDGYKWIPTAERLPKLESYTYSVDVLFYDYEEGIHVGYVALDTGTWKDKHSRALYAGHKVTHWMPLPEPPKEGN